MTNVLFYGLTFKQERPTVTFLGMERLWITCSETGCRGKNIKSNQSNQPINQTPSIWGPTFTEAGVGGGGGWHDALSSDQLYTLQLWNMNTVLLEFYFLFELCKFSKSLSELQMRAEIDFFIYNLQFSMT